MVLVRLYISRVASIYSTRFRLRRGFPRQTSPPPFFMDMRRHLFYRLKYCSESVSVKKILHSSFFLAFGNGPDLLRSLDCLTTSSISARWPNTYDDLSIDMVEIFERLTEILSRNRPVELPFDPDSNHRILVPRISACLDTAYCNGSLVLVESLIDPGLAVFVDGWVTSHLKLAFSPPDGLLYPPDLSHFGSSFEIVVYQQFNRLMAIALGSSTLFDGLSSSAFQQSVDAISAILRHILGVVENLYLYLRSNCQRDNPEKFCGIYSHRFFAANAFLVCTDLFAGFTRAWKYVSTICRCASRIWRHCEETISFILTLREWCTGERPSNFIHDCFNRFGRIGEEMEHGADGQAIVARLLGLV
jgi:hypothetical protein